MSWRQGGFRYYLIRVVGTSDSKTVYAPTLLAAFHVARCQGYGSHPLECLGSTV